MEKNWMSVLNKTWVGLIYGAERLPCNPLSTTVTLYQQITMQFKNTSGDTVKLNFGILNKGDH